MIKSFPINQEIYNLETILDTLDVFQEYWVKEYKDWFLQIESENEDEIQEIFNEFCNYMIFINN